MSVGADADVAHVDDTGEVGDLLDLPVGALHRFDRHLGVESW
jgi:hypothetical protein